MKLILKKGITDELLNAANSSIILHHKSMWENKQTLHAMNLLLLKPVFYFQHILELSCRDSATTLEK